MAEVFFVSSKEFDGKSSNLVSVAGLPIKKGIENSEGHGS